MAFLFNCSVLHFYGKFLLPYIMITLSFSFTHTDMHMHIYNTYAHNAHTHPLIFP